MKKLFATLVVAALTLCLVGCTHVDAPTIETQMPTPTEAIEFNTVAPTAPGNEPNTDTTMTDLPPFAGEAAVSVNKNIPYFTAEDITKAEAGEPFEFYSELDNLGRCGVTYANVCQETMPTEERGDIGMVRPSGWQTIRYDDLVDGKYLYNRCHLIGFQLAGENANTKNLITGTRYMNVQGMLPYENQVADYVHETNNHVLYRVTPIFEGNDLVARGVLMEGRSVEDNGQGLQFCAYCYNVQPGVVIDYATGESSMDETYTPTTLSPDTGAVTYILNTRSKKFHRPDCSGGQNIAEYNRQETSKSRDALIADGYKSCGICKP